MEDTIAKLEEKFKEYDLTIRQVLEAAYVAGRQSVTGAEKTLADFKDPVEGKIIKYHQGRRDLQVCNDIVLVDGEPIEFQVEASRSCVTIGGWDFTISLVGVLTRWETPHYFDHHLLYEGEDMTFSEMKSFVYKFRRRGVVLGWQAGEPHGWKYADEVIYDCL